VNKAVGGMSGIVWECDRLAQDRVALQSVDLVSRTVGDGKQKGKGETPKANIEPGLHIGRSTIRQTTYKFNRGRSTDGGNL